MGDRQDKRGRFERVWEEEKRFGIYIGGLREKRGYQLGQVSRGLCTEQMLSYLEKGKRAAPKLLQDALLERLGVGAENYEHYLYYKEYGRWEARQRILHCIAYGDVGHAMELLGQYRITYVKGPGGGLNASDRLERQFYLAMLAQARRLEGAGREELRALLDEAVSLSVPDAWGSPLKGMVLSIKELNLLLEAEQYREGGGSLGHYRELKAYIETAGLDGVGMAKIYPKAVYFLCCYLYREDVPGEAGAEEEACREAGVSAQRLLAYGRRAVECLRDNSRMYYLWELLGIQEKLLARILVEQGKAGAPEAMWGDGRKWKEALESVYTEYGVPKETFSYGYLYLEKGASCISDVIRIRRRMLGMSEEALCSGICDVKTLRRLENRKATSHREIVEELFGRLGLSRELTRTELVTEKQEARLLMEKLLTCITDRRTEEAEMLLARIKELVPMDMRCNQQALMRLGLILKRKSGELDGAEYFRQLRMALELTLPYEAFLEEGEKYLTYEEQCCIQNMMQVMDKTSGEFLACMKRFEEMYQPYETNLLIGTVNSMYELIMESVGSEWGNQGDYGRSDRYNEIILRQCLCFRRLHSVAAALYGRWWNYAERKRRGIPAGKALDGAEELARCLAFSILDKQLYYEPFYRKKLEQVLDKG